MAKWENDLDLIQRGSAQSDPPADFRELQGGDPCFTELGSIWKSSFS
jgi:hypothetical protein